MLLMMFLALFGGDLLSKTEAIVTKTFAITHMTSFELATLLHKNEAEILLFDVRKREEYEMSHLANAIHVEPEMELQTFMEQYRDQIAQKHLVFYCSVGYRSSKLAIKVEEQALQAGAKSVVNLRGGIFRWYNEGRQLINQAGPTQEIHPYDAFWGKLLNKKEP